jgi:hypothetical protein
LWQAIGPAIVAFGILAGVWMLSPSRGCATHRKCAAADGQRVCRPKAD